jgi:hypothetical protein
VNASPTCRKPKRSSVRILSSRWTQNSTYLHTLFHFILAFILEIETNQLNVI